MNRPPYGNSNREVLQPFANLKVSAKYTPEMRVWVSAGGFWNYTSSGMEFVEFVGGNSPYISAPGSNAKWSVVAIDTTGTIVIIDGTASSSPSIPNIPRGRVPLAAIYVQNSSTTITNDMIYDIRPVGYDLIPKSHIDLLDTTISGSHPISAITGLSDTLSTFVTTTTFESELENKADTDGTTDVSFTLNKDETGVPSSNCSFVVERGSSSNVSIRWNESSDVWEYTSDGSTYYAFSGFFYNDGNSIIRIKYYEQDDEPALTTVGQACFWKDTDDSNKVYLVFKDTSGSQVKVQLT